MAAAGWTLNITGHGLVDPRTIVEHPANPKIHTAEQDAVVEGSLRDLGWLKSLTLNTTTGHLLDGHERLALALARGVEAVPVEYVTIPEGAEAEALVLLDPSGQLYRTHVERWAGLVRQVQSGDAGVQAFLAQQAAQHGVVPVASEPPPSARPADTWDETWRETQLEEARQRWDVEVGQVWELGGHRVVCGDSTDPAVQDALLGGATVPCVFTDPPYTDGGRGRNFAADAPTQAKTYAGIQAAAWDQALDVDRMCTSLERVLGPDAVVYVCMSRWLAPAIWAWMDRWASFCSYVVWCKPNPAPALAKRHWTWATELIAYGVRGHHVCNFPEQGHALNWWALASPTHTTPHPTQKPLSVVTQALTFSTMPGQMVYDGYLGSGTTLVACEALGRRCVGVEQEPGYVAVTLERWAQASGKTPRCVR